MFGNELRRLALMFAETGPFVVLKQNKQTRLIILTTRPARQRTEATIETNIPAGWIEPFGGGDFER